MQLLRDNLTLWTSSDGVEPAADGAADEGKTEEAPEPKTEETATEPQPAATEAAPKPEETST